MWRPRTSEPALDRETVDGIIMKLMDIDDRLAEILRYLKDEDDEAEEDEP